jgi:hypothetical protein
MLAVSGCGCCCVRKIPTKVEWPPSGHDEKVSNFALPRQVKDRSFSQIAEL